MIATPFHFNFIYRNSVIEMNWNPSPPTSSGPSPELGILPESSSSPTHHHSTGFMAENEENECPRFCSEEATFADISHGYDRNQSGGESRANNDDRIGETMFSKAWALSLLVRTVESVSSSQQNICDVKEDIKDSVRSESAAPIESKKQTQRHSKRSEVSKCTGKSLTEKSESVEGSNFSVNC